MHFDRFWITAGPNKRLKNHGRFFCIKNSLEREETETTRRVQKQTVFKFTGVANLIVGYTSIN